MVASACDGYNVCLMAYGETGAGKTHTMQGQGNDEMRGIIKRAIEQINGFCESQVRTRVCRACVAHVSRVCRV